MHILVFAMLIFSVIKKEKKWLHYSFLSKQEIIFIKKGNIVKHSSTNISPVETPWRPSHGHQEHNKNNITNIKFCPSIGERHAAQHQRELLQRNEQLVVIQITTIKEWAKILQLVVSQITTINRFMSIYKSISWVHRLSLISYHYFHFLLIRSHSDYANTFWASVYIFCERQSLNTKYTILCLSKTYFICKYLNCFNFLWIFNLLYLTNKLSLLLASILWKNIIL